MELKNIPINKISPSPFQPRESFNKESLKELAESIKEFSLLHPIIVRPTGNGTYQIVAGERRWRAAQFAGLKEIPAIVKDIDEKQQMIESLIENIHREDLSTIEKGMAVKQIFEEHGITMSPRELSKNLGRMQEYVNKETTTATMAVDKKLLSIIKKIGKPFTTIRQWLDAISVDETILKKELKKKDPLNVGILAKIGRIEDHELQKKIYAKLEKAEFMGSTKYKTTSEKARKFITVIQKLPEEEREVWLEPDTIIDVETLEAMTVKPELDVSDEQKEQLVKVIKEATEREEEMRRDPERIKMKMSAWNMRHHALIETMLDKLFCPICGADWRHLQWTCHGIDLKSARMIAEDNFRNKKFTKEE